jgi:hypothetical protein
MEPAGVEPERDPNPTERSEPHPARAEDDGSSAHDAPEPGHAEDEERCQGGDARLDRID